MTMTETNEEPAGGSERSPEEAAVDQLVDAGLLDELMARVDAGDL